jgi:hypothetical protein
VEEQDGGRRRQRARVAEAADVASRPALAALLGERHGEVHWCATTAGAAAMTDGPRPLSSSALPHRQPETLSPVMGACPSCGTGPAEASRIATFPTTPP